jgi:hypothetical protein
MTLTWLDHSLNTQASKHCSGSGLNPKTKLIYQTDSLAPPGHFVSTSDALNGYSIRAGRAATLTTQFQTINIDFPLICEGMS